MPSWEWMRLWALAVGEFGERAAVAFKSNNHDLGFYWVVRQAQARNRFWDAVKRYDPEEEA